MKVTAKVRLVFFVIVTLVIGGFFFFEPTLNIGTTRALSMYQQIVQGEAVMPIIVKWFIITITVFLGLLFLIGLEEKQDSNNKQDKETANGKISSSKEIEQHKK